MAKLKVTVEVDGEVSDIYEVEKSKKMALAMRDAIHEVFFDEIFIEEDEAAEKANFAFSGDF